MTKIKHMKHTLKCLFVTTHVSVAITSCTEDQKEDAATPIKNLVTTAGYTCKVDGVDFTADSSRVNMYNDGFSIIAFKAGATSFEFNLYNSAIGTHTLTPRGSEEASYIVGQNVYVSQAGSITISTLDSATSTATGIFNFVAFGLGDSTTKTIASGLFSIK